jgi:hypothetical protein
MSTIITLEDLAASATGTATRAASKAFHTLTVEESRPLVKIKDGNRKPAEDGSQRLTVVIGKHTLPMDCIKAGTSRIAVSADQVEGYTVAIQGLIDSGSFDEVIEKAQVLAKAQYEKALANPVTRTKAAPAEATEGLDLDAIADESDVSTEQVDLDEEL